METNNVKEEKKEIQLPVSLRDYLAAKAMQGGLSDFSFLAVKELSEHKIKLIAIRSYAIADAMLLARNLKETK